MRPLWYMTHAVVDRMEADTEFAKFVHESEWWFKKFSKETPVSEDEPVSATFEDSGTREWCIRIVTNWDRSKTTICFPGEEIEE